MSAFEVVLILFQFVVLIFALSIHECAHAWTAWRLGDPTAYMLGRVTLNPLKQLTWLGSVIFPLLGMFFGVPLIGWAKPTPVTPRNFKHYKRDSMLVTAAGPVVNLLCALLALTLLLVVKHTTKGDLVDMAMAVAFHVPFISLEQLPTLFPLVLFLYFAVLTNVALFLFNLLPIPPLDGSRILMQVLPPRAAAVYESIGSWSILLMYFLVWRTGVLSAIFGPVLGMFNWMLVRF